MEFWDSIKENYAQIFLALPLESTMYLIYVFFGKENKFLGNVLGLFLQQSDKESMTAYCIRMSPW